MATFTVTLQGGTPTTVEATDKIQFAGANFGDAITIATYQDTTHVESSVGANDSSGNTPKNSKFISQAGGTGGDSQVDIGGGTVDLDTVSTANSPIKINFAHATSVALSGVKFYAYDGTTPATAPTEVTFKAAEQADTNWVEAGGSASALTLGDKTTNTSHDFYLLISASPTTVGLKTAFKLRFELTYS